MTRQIACGHCGQSHPSVAEVRACATDHPVDATLDGRPLSDEEPVSAPAPRPSPAAGQLGDQRAPRRSPQPTHRATSSAPPSARSVDEAIDRTPAQLAGPSSLGRSLTISPQSAIPDPWKDCDVVAASADSSRETVEMLHRAWRERRRLVIEWSGPLPSPTPVLTETFYELGPTAELPGERLRFAVTANAVNMLGSSPSFEPITLALEAGLDLAPATTSGDVAQTDGTTAWADGGPLSVHRSQDVDGLDVIPRPHLVARRGVTTQLDPPPPAAELAPDQIEAVAHGGGPARIIAPAGSGKTRVLTERTRHLVGDRDVHPAAVSLVAYNRRARQEMEERLVDIPGLDIRTLNSLALAIATGSGPFSAGRQPRRLTTISEMEARRLLDNVVPGRRRRQLTDPLEPWIDALSACRLGLRDPTEIESTYGGDVAGFPEVLESYRHQLQQRGELDFDEQILAALEILLTNPEARAAARRVTPILLVDEFQDLTPAHMLLVRLLAGPATEVFAVGDDDQTIYGYSGARPEWLVDFTRFFPGAEDHPLTVNYRCPPEVVAAASNLLSHNQNRVAKTINPGPRADTATGDQPVATANHPGLIINEKHEPQQLLVSHVESLLNRGAQPGDIAVLARVNAALLPAAIYLANAGLPVAKPVGVDVHVLDRSGVGAAFSWLRLAVAPEQKLRADDLRLALRRPPRSLHPKITDWVCEQRSIKHLMALSDRLTKENEAQRVREFAADIGRLRRHVAGGASVAETLDFIYGDIGLLGAASQLDQSQRTARRAAHADELGALRALAVIGPAADEFEGWIRDHLQALPRLDDPDRDDAITLATIHTTKGLEWPHVIIHDVRGDLHPHRLATDNEEEERRIFHVAITRGRESVLVNAHPARSGPPRSPFVAEMGRPRPAEKAWPQRAPSSSAAPGGKTTKPEAVTSGGKAAKPERPEPSSPEEAARRQALTEWRSAQCKTEGVPAYLVLGNATLDAIASSAPASLQALGKIKGIGPAKLERYGADILGVVAGTNDAPGG